MLDLAPLNELASLITILTADNELADLQSCIEILSKMPKLKNLDLSGNPLTKTLRYREYIIGACEGLETIDGRVIGPSSRKMMRNLARARDRCQNEDANRPAITKTIGKSSKFSLDTPSEVSLPKKSLNGGG